MLYFTTPVSQADKNISVRCTDSRFTSMCTADMTLADIQQTDTSQSADTLAANFKDMTNSFSTKLQTLQRLSLDMDAFPDIDPRTIHDQFASNDKYETIMLSKINTFQEALKSGQCMTQPTGDSIFFLIKIRCTEGTVVTGIFDTGSSEFISLKSALESNKFMSQHVGSKQCQVVGGGISTESAYKIL